MKTIVYNPGLTVSIPALERCLHQYIQEASEEPFNIKSVPLVTAAPTEMKTDVIKPKEKVAASRQEIYSGKLTCPFQLKSVNSG